MVNGGKGGICTYLLSIGIELRKEAGREGVSFGDARFECPSPFATPVHGTSALCARWEGGMFLNICPPIFHKAWYYIFLRETA